MNPRQTLKKLLQREKLLVAPGCFDGLSARLVQEAGYEAAYLSGGAVARSGPRSSRSARSACPC